MSGGMLLASTARRLSRTLHGAMLGGVLQSPVSFFDASPRGRVLNRFTADIDYVDSEVFVAGKQSVQGVLLAAAKVVVVGTQSPAVVVITVVVVGLAACGINLAVRASHRSRFFESAANSRYLQHMTETLESLSSVRAYGVAERFRHHFFRLVDTCIRGYAGYCDSYRFTRSLTAAGAFLILLSALLLNTIFVGQPDPSSLGLALSAATSVPLQMMTLCVVMFTTLQMMVAFERCLEYTELTPETDILTAPDEENNMPSSHLTSDWPSEGKIEFLVYSTSYRPGVTPNVLSDLTFTVRPMEKVAVVGRTGAGKSSLVLALLRMLRASGGRILIDGVDISEVPLRRLRRSITVIPQDPSLMRGTLRMNLDPTESHSDEDLWRVLHQTHLAAVVHGCAEGLEMKIADGGSNISVGQRQLVCLARSLLRGSKVLLLDEATAQMDEDTDLLIQMALREAFAACTVLAVAHRVHTVLDYDRILVIEEGRVKEYDTPACLLSNANSHFFKMAVDSGLNTTLRRQDFVQVASL